MQRDKWGIAAHAVSGVRLTESFYDLGGGSFRQALLRGNGRKNAEVQSLVLRSAVGVSASTPAVLCDRANCASQFSIFSGLYEYGMIGG